MKSLVISLWITGCILAAADRKPNIVIIFTDDQGYADLGCFGAEGFETPNIDRMARHGRKFTNFHVAQPVCSASRAALLTGCYPNRIGIHGALGPNSKIGLSHSETTIAEILKEEGYATCAVGKWHLGDHSSFLPTNHGFDEYLGLPYSNDMWPFHPRLMKLAENDPKRKRTYPDLPLIEGTKIIDEEITAEDQKQLTTRYAERAVSFIERNHEKPFFLYLAHSMPHVPLFVSDKFNGKSKNGIYGDVIMEIDWSVGQVIGALEKHDLTNDTWVIFTSDNGPWLSYGHHGGSAKPLREGKGTTWEGGTRVPCVMQWPGRIPTDSSSDQMLMTIDLLPSIAKVADASLPKLPIDGRDCGPIIFGEKEAVNPHDAYYFYYHRNHLHAVTSGDGEWKLYLPHSYRTMNGKPGGKGGMPEAYQQAKVSKPELYHLKTDVSETTDVAEMHPEIVEKLQESVAKARLELGDALTKSRGQGARQAGKVR